MSQDDAGSLKPGDAHYTAYVGPPEQYDFMGATQFRLLCALGLRAHHRVLDFGCGSLRAGRFLLMYLNPGCYYGIEPNRWLIEDAIKHQIGQGAIDIKQPVFDGNDRFETQHLGVQFDYIVAQSIFSHTGRQVTEKCLSQFAGSIKPTGRIIASFWHADEDPPPGDWFYPGCVTYRPSSIAQIIAGAGLVGRKIPWYHPRLVWYVMGKSHAVLPSPEMDPYLRGAVLFDPEFAESCQAEVRRVVPKPLHRLRKLFHARSASE